LDDEQQTAPTPLALMRSRYTAYVLERAPYLLTTWHPDHRPAELVFEPGLKWLGLEVRSFSQSDNTGRVHFVARVRDASGRANRIEERSRFVLLSGRWLYLDGLA
jgi:SEC-C motif-containing protein